MTSAREDVYKAMFALVTPLMAGNKGKISAATPFVLVTREVIEVQRRKPEEQPCLMQYEFNEANEYNGRLLVKRVWTVVYIIGVTHDAKTTGASLLNPLIDVVEACFRPTDDEPITLGGLVTNVQLSGIAGKDHGDNSTKAEFRQSAYYLPVDIYLPGS